MEHCMVDIETLGRRPGCVILSIGAVMFDPAEGLGPEFHMVIHQQSCLNRGLHIEDETKQWWYKQNGEAQQVLRESMKSTAPALDVVLQAFGNFLTTNAPEGNVKMWGNGASFDNAIIAEAYRKVGRELPWKYWNDRCYRTLKNLIRADVDSFVGVKHDALADAKNQALHAIKLLRLLPA